MAGAHSALLGLGLEDASFGHPQVSILPITQASNSWAFFPAFFRAPGRARLSWGGPGTLHHSGGSAKAHEELLGSGLRWGEGSRARQAELHVSINTLKQHLENCSGKNKQIFIYKLCGLVFTAF